VLVAAAVGAAIAPRPAHITLTLHNKQHVEKINKSCAFTIAFTL